MMSEKEATLPIRVYLMFLLISLLRSERRNSNQERGNAGDEKRWLLAMAGSTWCSQVFSFWNGF